MPAEPTKPDSATLQRLAALAGHDLPADRAAALVGDVAALAEADRRLATLDLGASPADGPPWGASDD
jgi:hypothetical protein